jgi:hypothetical protein
MAVNKLQLKRSAVAGKEPTTSSLALGELAINTYEGKVFLKKDNGVETIVQLADVSGSIFSASYAQTSSHSDNFTVTGPVNVYGSQYISGSLVVGNDITARRLVVQTITSSVIYSSGSNVFGDATSDTQTFTGSVNISGSLNLVGNQTINSGYELTVDGINVNTIGDRSGGTLTLTANTSSVSGFLTVNNSISASGKIEAVSFTGSFSGSINNLQGTATHIPYFSSSQVLANSAIYQVSSESIAINQNGVTTAAPEALYVWQPSDTSFNVISGKGNLDNYLQLNIQNTNQGVSASSDVVATANNGDENNNYINMGINSENFNGPIGEGNDAYLYSTGNNLHIGNTKADKHLGFFVGGDNADTDKKLQLNPTGHHQMTGSLDIDSQVTASRFVTRGATAAQFVKGDGSLDSTLYTSASVFNNTTSSLQEFSASMLAFTASTLINSASFDTRINYISSSFNASTASFNAYSASMNAFSASMLSFTASQKDLNGTLATTGSNIFKGNQIITGSLSVSGSTNIYGTTNITGSVNVSGSTGTAITANVDTIVFTGSYAQLGNVNLSSSVDITGSLVVNGRNYINDSASFDTRINYISSSFNASTASINSFTASINAFSASMLTTTASMNAFSSSVLNFTSSTLVNSASFDTRINYVSTSFEAATASMNLFSASILSYTASNNEFVADMLTETASLQAATASLNANTASMNLFSASVLSFTSSTLVNSASFDTRINYLSSSFEANTASINLFTASFNAFSSSILNTTASINAFSASMLSFTASQKDLNGTLATTGSNTFIGNQVISGSTSMTGSLSLTGSQNIIGNLTVTDTITAERLIVQFITSSVAQVTGSTKFGDKVTDTHQFTGSVLVSGSLVVNGRDYITDSGSFDTRINYISSSFEAATASLNLFSASILSYTASNNEFVADILTETASLQAATASLNLFSSSILNFTASTLINSASFDTRINYISSSFEATTASLNAFSASILSYTASNNAFVADILTETASLQAATSSLNLFSASVLSFTASTLIDSASFDTRINYVSSSFEAATASLNLFSASMLSYTASNNEFVADILLETASLQAATASLYNFSSSILSYTASNNLFVADMLLETASLQAATASLNLFSASMLSFTASTLINSASFDTRIQYVSTSFEAHTASFNNFSSSILNTTASINNFSASVLAYTSSNDITISAIYAETASLQAATASLNLFSASMLSFTASQKNSNGTFATTGSNTFYGTETISGSLLVSGSTNLTNLTASGLNYPTIDGLEGQTVQTDGAGNLFFNDIETIYESIRNGEAFTLVKGTPVYVSGSQGANPIVYAADAANPAKMPVTYVIDEDILSNEVGRGILLGLITGINLTGYTAGAEVYVAAGGGWTSTRPTGSAIIQVLGIITKPGNGGQGLVLNPGPANLPNIQSGYTWVGNSNGYPIAVATSSIQNVVSASYAGFAETIAAGLNITASNLSVTNNANIGGNLVVNGTASFNYVETISGSAVIIGQEFIILNTQLPAARFAGLKIFDSGSTNATASIVWDSERNHLVYQNASGSSYAGGGFMSGPRNTGSLGDETYPTFNRILRGQGGDHLYDSNISDNNTVVSIGIDTSVTGSLNVSNGITGSLLGNIVGNVIGNVNGNVTGDLIGTSSYAANADLLDGLDSTSFVSTGSFGAQTAIFNAFSASILSYTSSAIIDSGSVSTRLVNLEVFSSSLDSTFATDADLNALSSSFIAHTASMNAFIASMLSFTASQRNLNDTYATTGSNTFRGTETISGSLLISGSGTVVGFNSDTLEVTGSLIVAGTSSLSGLSSITGSSALICSFFKTLMARNFFYFSFHYFKHNVFFGDLASHY